MKSSILLKQQNTLSDSVYARYIYDCILGFYQEAGYEVRTGLPEGKQVLKAEDGRILWVLDIPETGRLKQKLWQSFTWPQIVRKLAPEKIYVLAPPMAVQRKLKSPQWLFITHSQAFAGSKDQNKKALKERTALINKILLADQTFVYATTLAQQIEGQRPVLLPKLADIQPGLNIWTPYPGSKAGALDWDVKEIIKTKYAQGNEYFLIDASGADQKVIMHYLKAFSHFKKWQKSSMQLIILMPEMLADKPAFQEMIGSYYFRKDVQLLQRPSPETLYDLIASSYAVIDPDGREDQLTMLLAAAQYGTLAVAVATPAATDLLGDALFIIPGPSVKEIGQIMITIHKSEILRAKYIKAGLQKAQTFRAFELNHWLDNPQ